MVPRRFAVLSFLLPSLHISLFLAAGPARAQVLLKPRGGNAAPLRAKSVTADIRIRGRFAATDLDLTFQNTLTQRVEADFVYALPAHAVVTYFAYYYGDERVVARVAEKERAARIYRYITSRMRDPALIELIGKNTFRADFDNPDWPLSILKNGPTP